jgi:hypothetical protein
MKKNGKYQILNSDDFKQIAEETGYQKDYVRQVLRSYSGQTKFNQKIFDSADKTIELKIRKIREQ